MTKEKHANPKKPAATNGKDDRRADLEEDVFAKEEKKNRTTQTQLVAGIKKATVQYEHSGERNRFEFCWHTLCL